MGEMTREKYRLREELSLGLPMYRLYAVRSFGAVEDGQRGGLVASPDTLSHEGDCWIDVDARAHEKSYVGDDAQVKGNAWLGGRARVTGNAVVMDDTWVVGNAMVMDHAVVDGGGRVLDSARVREHSVVSGTVCLDAEVRGHAVVGPGGHVQGGTVSGYASVQAPGHVVTIAGLLPWPVSVMRTVRPETGEVGHLVVAGCRQFTLDEWEDVFTDEGRHFASSPSRAQVAGFASALRPVVESWRRV